MHPVRWGILSAGKIALDHVVPATQLSSNGYVSAIASVTPGKAEHMAAPYPAITLYDSYEALLTDPDVDAIYIPLPNTLHVEWSKRCLAAGKPVLCEKPIAMHASEIDELIAARDAAGVLAAEAFMVMFHPQWQRAREIIEGGELGELAHVDGVFSYFNDDPGNIRNQLDVGGGALRDIGVYPIVTTRIVTGAEPVSVRGDITRDPRGGTDTLTRAWCDFDHFRLDFYVSTRMQERQEMVFHCRHGWIRVAAPFNAGKYGEAFLEICDARGNRRLERYPMVNQYTLQAEAFAESVRSGAAYACPLEFSRGNQAVVDALFVSAENGGRTTEVGGG